MRGENVSNDATKDSEEEREERQRKEGDLTIVID